MAKIESEGLSLGYRLRWRIIYTLLFILGPAQQTGMNDPHVRMRAERAERVRRARAAKQDAEPDGTPG